MFLKTIADYLKEKASSTIVFSYVVFYILCNCRWIFASLFTDQNLIFEKYHLLKNEYIYQYFPELHPDNPLFWFCNLLPFLLTYLYIWWAPRIIHNPAYKKQLQYKNERRSFKLKEETKLLSLEKNVIKTEASNTDALIELENKKDELKEKNPEQLLDEEYNQFKSNSNWAIALNELCDIVYKNYGNITQDAYPELLMLLDVNGLTEPGGLNGELIEITDKGKEFLRRALNENQL